MVIGIIVALAAVIVPLLAQFSGTGAAAAQDAEWDFVQTSIDTLMADTELTTVSPSTASTRISDTLDWDPSAATETLAAYTRDANTGYCYEWTSSGTVTAQYELDTSTTPVSCSTTQTNP